MRQADLDLMRAAYPVGASPLRNDDRFADALGLALPRTRELENAIFGDLDPVEYGIGWWSAYEPAFGVRARIFVGDQLLSSVASVETNVVDAKLHLMEFLDAHEREDAFLSGMVQLDPNGQPEMRAPPRTCALDDLSHRMAALHTAGFFRALATAFDCVGAGIAGVLALNGWIMEASFGKSRGALKNLTPDPARDCERKNFRTDLEAIIIRNGRTGWLEWLLDYRHMLVHRARRFEIVTLDPKPTSVPNTRGQPILRTTTIPRLARDPARSDVEVWVEHATTPPVLGEHAGTTMDEILKSSVATLEDVAAALLQFWTWRKSNVAALVQPDGQWSNGAAGDVTGFVGYANRLSYNPTAMSANPSAIDRMSAASVLQGAHTNWPAFNGRGDNR